MIWIRRNQLARRNLTDDQRSINAERLRQLESERAKTERASKARSLGGKATPDQIEDRLSDNVADKRSAKAPKPKRDTRKGHRRPASAVSIYNKIF